MSLWLEVKALLDSEPEDWARLAEVFAQHGLEGTVQTDSPPTMSAFLSPQEQHQADALVQALTRSAGVIGVDVHPVQEENWAESWKQYFRPRRVGKRWLIRPSWEECEPKPGERVIVLDPGQCFGTGDHPTTRLCLELLEEVDCTACEVADIGCGSGVLSVAAMLAGARSVWAVDVDPAAVQATLDNAGRNGVQVQAAHGEGFQAFAGAASHPLTVESPEKGLAWTDDESYEQAMRTGDVPTTSPNYRVFDLVLSNIVSAAIIRLSATARDRIRKGGTWVVSGIIEQNWPDVLAACSQAGFTLESTQREDDWVAARFTR